MERGASLSPCGVYRYALTRTWDQAKSKACVIMLNPSTADAMVDDATIRALVRLLTPLCLGGFEVVNLFALRSTNPAALMAAERPIGPLNDLYIVGAINRCDLVVCAWGAHKFVLQSMRGVEVMDLVKSMSLVPQCFGTTKAGAPKHPLYLKTGTTLRMYHG